MLELAHVGQVVVGRQVPLARPGAGLGQPPLRDPHPRPQRGDRPHVRQEVADVLALGLVEQGQRAVQVPFGHRQTRHRDARAIGVLRQPGVLAQLAAL